LFLFHSTRLISAVNNTPFCLPAELDRWELPRKEILRGELAPVGNFIKDDMKLLKRLVLTVIDLTLHCLLKNIEYLQLEELARTIKGNH